jgi:hypothetical protein
MSLREDCRELAAPWVTRPKLRLALEALAIRRTFVPYDGNNDARKILTTILGVTWMILTIGYASGRFGADPSLVFYGPLSALIGLLVGRMWGLEVQGLAGPLQIGTGGDDDDE